MKRRWRIGWMLLAALLVTLAAWLFIAWPKAPRWRIDLAKPVGFDLNQRLLWTLTEQQDDDCQLIGYDLDTGTKRIVYPLAFDMPQNNPGKYLQGTLSADNKILACFDNSTSIQTFDLQSQCQKLCTIPATMPFSIAISANGKTLALLKNFVHIEIRDTRSGELRKTLKIPETSRMGISGRILCDPNLMQFSDDCQFLAAVSVFNNAYVFDVDTGRVVGECDKSQYPLFLSNKNVLVTIPDFNSDSEKSQQWYEVDKESVKQLPQAHHFDSKDQLRGIACNSNYACYFKWVNKGSRALPKWIPATLRHKLEVALGRYHIYYDVLLVDTNTGKMEHKFPFQVEEHHPSLMYYDAMISLDGSLLAFKEDYSLSLWDIPPRRSLTCWLVCSGIILVALWLAWPRRVKLQPLAQPPATTK